jgi:MFS family permease
MQIIAQGWLVYQISGSELALGIVGFASAIPALLVSPMAGVITDRVSRRAMLVATQTSAMLLALILATLTFMDVVEVWHVVLLAAGLGLVNSFDGPARQAFVVEMVGREDMPNAIALNSMTFNSGRIIGPAIGGAVLVWLGAAWCFLLNGLSFVAVITGLLMMRLPPRERVSTSLSPWRQMKSALEYLGGQPELRALLLMALAFSLFGITYSTVLPAFIDKVLGQGAAAFGTINAMTGIGAVSGALIVAKWGDRGQRGRWLTWAILGFPIVLTFFAVNRVYPLSLLLAVLLGVSFMLTFTLINTLLQTNLLDEMRGRVLSLYTLTFFGFTPFGNLAIGSMSEWIGLSQAIVISAALCFVAAGAILVLVPSVRKLP